MDKKRFKYCYHEIPFSDKEATKQRPYTLVGIIDASGSMGKLWKLLVAQWNGLLEENRHNQTFTITFDTKARCNMLDPALRTLLNKHGGGGTTLDEPFLKFQEIWREQIPPQNEIKVVFISDGQDNELATLQNRLEKLRPVVPGQIVTFMCLGILSEFPTFVSMKLRDIYHTGDPTCPSVFLIEYLSEKALFNKFQSIRTFLRTRKLIKVEPSQIIIPWEACVDEMPEGTRFCSEDDKVFLPTENKVLEFDPKKTTAYNISELFRNWTLRLQLDVLNKKLESNLAKEYAVSALSLMREMVDDFKVVSGIDLLSDKEPKDGIDFVTRVQANQCRYERLKIQGFLETMRKISEGKMITAEEEYEAAKQLGLGTVIGKHKQKVFALKLLTKEFYTDMVEEFVKLVEKLIISELPGDQSFSLLESQREVFRDSTIANGLRLVSDPYTMIECFPLVGLSLEVKRPMEAQADMWKIQVKAIPRVHSIGDTLVIVRTNNQALLSVGEGKPQEKINFVLPLFGKDDKDMTALINSRLFQHLVSYFFTETIDLEQPQAYLAAISALFLYIINSEIQQIDQTILDKIFYTMDILYQDPKGYVHQFINTLVNSPDIACSPYNERANTQGYYNLSQIFPCVFYLRRKNMMEPEEVEEILQRCYVEYFAERIKRGEKLSQFVTFGEVEACAQSIMKQFEGTKILTKFNNPKKLRLYLAKDLKKELDKFIQKDMHKSSQELILNQSFLGGDRKDQVLCLDKMLAISKFFQMDTVSDRYLLAYLVHALKTPGEVLRQRELISLNFSDNSDYVKSKVDTVEDTSFSSKLIGRLQDLLPQKYKEVFRDVHFELLPMDDAKLQAECKRLALPKNALVLDANTGFLKNACIAPRCPHYLQPLSTPVRNHMSGWCGELPRGFHTLVKANKHLADHEILQKFKAAIGVTGDTIYGFPSDRVLQYISHVKQFYLSK